MSKIRETIHHGNYRNVREIECPDDPVAALTLLGHTSPYPFTFRIANSHYSKAAIDLARNGSCEVGWSTYEIVSDETTIHARLEYLRQELRAERISYSELAELQALAPHIDPGDVELLEAASVPEYDDTEAESVSISDMDDLVARASAWDIVSAAANAEHSAPDLCAIVYEQQEELRKR